MTPRAAIYARVSRASQDLDAQLAELTTWGGGGPDAILYVEKVSGTGREPRAEYDRLLRDARRPDRPWDVLYVWSVDRLSREARYERTIDIIHDLEARGVRIRFLRNPAADTPAEGGMSIMREMSLCLYLLWAIHEADTIQARTQLRMDEIKRTGRTRSGKPVGRPLRLTQERIAEVARLRAQGLPYAAIAQRVGLPKGTCRKAAYLARSQSAAFQTGEAKGGEG